MVDLIFHCLWYDNEVNQNIQYQIVIVDTVLTKNAKIEMLCISVQQLVHIYKAFQCQPWQRRNKCQSSSQNETQYASAACISTFCRNIISIFNYAKYCIYEINWNYFIIDASSRVLMSLETDVHRDIWYLQVFYRKPLTSRCSKFIILLRNNC